MGGVWFGLGKRVDLTFLGTNKKPRKMLNKIRNGRKQNLQHLDRFGKQHKHLFSGMQHLQKSSFVSLSTRLVVSFCFPPLMMEFISMSAMINFDTSLNIFMNVKILVSETFGGMSFSWKSGMF